ncbi:arsenate reductase family protein [Clostridium gasigenes]|uniref:Arsenate reductase family protein n=1 Tax=Clostridium gasigenes TaxID=94869 RepID=A0A7X0SDD9_9CLOT|nr:arsenate reductase family protein [Clostridium gasigenes]MBB6715420.1 arsenate reductase family protein [Clostridium gasigenes]MBU3089019.1 arsenate reductase family protein [Clostridium gasigenes]MBU3133515.1 arsenate reductase family protein [Clostridium gasigenes]MBU3137241.1 arsenate reductase family protein [Clostridium gasigenes]NKF07772.1 arsenate reductase family protein [Clostridium gasigenes]
MSIVFIEYPKCTTCIKAKKFLEYNKLEFTDRHIVENKPTKDELREWLIKSGLNINKFFNTSGKLYREMELKDKVKVLDQEELLEILSTDGMLVKRPIIVTDEVVLVGFKEEQWVEKLK